MGHYVPQPNFSIRRRLEIMQETLINYSPGAPWGLRESLHGIVALIVISAISNALLLGFLFLDDSPDVPAWALLSATLVLQVGLTASAVALGPHRFRVPVAGLFGPVHLSTARLFGWGIGAVLLSIIGTAVLVALASLVSDRFIPEPLPVELDLESLRLLSFISIVLIAPVVEETFFRGFLFSGLARSLSVWRAAAVSSAIFAATHVDVALLGPAFLSGIIFAGVYRKTGSLWPAILAHTAQNAIAFGLAT
jgi:membrane protease YdiL (CAAX protease family)